MVIYFVLYCFMMKQNEMVLVLKSGTRIECSEYKVQEEWVVVMLAPGFQLEGWDGPRKFKLRTDKVDWKATSGKDESLSESSAKAESGSTKPIEMPKKSKIIQKRNHPTPEAVPSPPALVKKEAIRPAQQNPSATKLPPAKGNENESHKNIEPDPLEHHSTLENGSLNDSKPISNLVPLKERTDRENQQTEAGEGYRIPFEVDSWLPSNVFNSVSVLQKRGNDYKIKIDGFFSGRETLTLRYDLILKQAEKVSGRDEFMIKVSAQKPYSTELWVRVEEGKGEMNALISFKDFF